MIIESIVVFLLTFAFVIFLSKVILKVVYTKGVVTSSKNLICCFLFPLRIYEDVDFIVNIAKKIALRYLGTLEHPISHEFIERSKEGQGIALEINPKYYSTWDHGKQ